MELTRRPATYSNLRVRRNLVVRLQQRREATQCAQRKRGIWSRSDHQIHQRITYRSGQLIGYTDDDFDRSVVTDGAYSTSGYVFQMMFATGD
jgi:hypothetical protein